MESKLLLKTALESSWNLTLPLLQDLQDAPLAFPTSKGGNHAWWVLGHLTFSEGRLMWEMARGEPNPAADLKPFFDGGTEPSADGKGYPAWGTLLERLQGLRRQSLELLDTLDEAGLDRKSVGCPPGFEPFFGTFRAVYLTTAMHWMMHRGQLADCRRALGRKPLMA